MDIGIARRLKADGFPWRPKQGDYYLSGVTGLVCPYDGFAVRDEDVFLPRVDDLLEWLRQQGYDYHVQRNHPSRRTWVEGAEFRIELGCPPRLPHLPAFYGQSLLEAVVAAVLWLLRHR